jgi:hypothetical protein
LAGSALLLGYLGWRSLGWPLIHDAPLMHYVAWVIAHGGAPYRDVFDMNVPGVYALHWAVLMTLGGGDFAWRLLDLAWLGATGIALFGYGRGLGGREAGLAVALLFALFHVAGGAWRVGQRDFLLCLFLVAGAWCIARSWEAAGARVPLVAAGLILGAGVMLKPHAGLFWLGCAVAAGLGARRAGRSAALAASIVLAAGLVVPALLIAWLAADGAIGAFASILGGYVIPLYGHVGRASVWEALRWHHLGRLVLALLAALAAAGLTTRRPTSVRLGLACLGVGYGLVHWIVQGKGWEYHLYPLAMFLCLLAAPAFAPIESSGRGAASLPALRRVGALGLLTAAVVVLAVKGVDALDAPWIAAKERTVTALTADLRAVTPPDSTVQVMDTTAGGIHALLRLGRRQPTRFMYDFHFFHDTADVRIQALRAEFAAGLAASPPAAIVVLRDTWPDPGYARVGQWPAVAGLLERRYALAREGDGYRIYAKRSDP